MMDDTPRLNWRGFNGPIVNTSCGRVAMDNHHRAFWQSRANTFDPPDLIDLSALAQAVRASFPTEETAPC